MAGGYPTFREGMGLKDFKAREMQKMSDAARRFDNMKVAAPLYLRNTPSGVRMGIHEKRVSAPRAPVGDVRPFFLFGEDRDFLEAKSAVGEGGVKIAKPFTLRWRDRVTIRGFSFRYFQTELGIQRIKTLVSDPAQQELQIVVEKYFINEVGAGFLFPIWAVKTDTLMSSTVEGEPPPDVEWLDLNVDGRAWAQVAPA